jgi:two-component system phosphate regulon sensor histidine kinase PhoR
VYSLYPWRTEFWTVFGLLALLWFVGLLFGLSGWLALAGLAGYVGWHLYYSWRLVSWLGKQTKKLPHHVPGIWGYVYYRLEVRKRKATERKKQIARLLKQFRASTSALPDATIVLDQNFQIQWVNDAASGLLGIRKSDSGQPVVNLIRSPAFSSYLEAHEFSEPLQLSAVTGRDSRLLLRVIPYGSGQYLLQLGDITERYRLEQMRRDFIANASHELRTPLSVLQGSIEQLEPQVAGNAAAEKPLERMRRQSERMMRILQDLLILARLEGGRNDTTQLVSLSTVVNEVVEEARIASEGLGAHQFEVSVIPDICIQGQRQDLHAAISNLVMNAVRYTPTGGRIRISLAEARGGVRFQVADNGPGILPQHLPRLTERFYRVDVGRSRESGGTGLGLSIVKHVLERYHSQIEISSIPGKGSTFSFLLHEDVLCAAGPRALASQ